MTLKDTIIISEIIKLGQNDKGMLITLEDDNKYYCVSVKLQPEILSYFLLKNYKYKYKKCIFRIRENEIIDFGYSNIKLPE